MTKELRKWVCVNPECLFEGKVQLRPEGAITEFCVCGTQMTLVPVVDAQIAISVREANALRHLLMPEFFSHNKYELVHILMRRIDEELTKLGFPFNIEVIDIEKERP